MSASALLSAALFAAFFAYQKLGLDPYIAVFALAPAFFALGYGLQRFIIGPASRGDDRTRADIAALGLPMIVGEPDDLTTLVTPGTTTVPISGVLDNVDGSARSSTGPASGPGVAVRMLTSGTTGPPKRIDLSYDMLARSVMGREPERATAPTELRRGVAIVNSPLVHIGGIFRVLQCVAEARSFVLLERFELNAWADAVRKHRPRAVSLVPAALRTVLHSDLPRTDLESVRRKLAHDLYYIRHLSPWLDLCLLLCTAFYALGVPFRVLSRTLRIPASSQIERSMRDLVPEAQEPTRPRLAA